MPGELHELSVAIGNLQSDVKNLSQTVRDNQETSTAEHREVHIIVTAMAESMRVVAAKVEKMEPLTDDYREKRAEARGAARFLNAAYALGGGLAAMFGSKAFEWWISVKPPHM